MARKYQLLGLRFSLICALAISGCQMGPDDVTGEAVYLPLAGQHYRTKVDLYLFSNPYDKFPRIGRNDPISPHGAKMLPKTVSVENIGKSFAGATILDVVPAGAELINRSVRRDTSSQGVIVFFICSLDSSGKRMNNVNTFFIQSNFNGHDGGLPKIDPSIAEGVD